MENVAKYVLGEIDYSRRMFYNKKDYYKKKHLRYFNSLRRMAFYLCSQFLLYTLITSRFTDSSNNEIF